MNIFCPLITQSPPSFTARVCAAATSDPAPVKLYRLVRSYVMFVCTSPYRLGEIAWLPELRGGAFQSFWEGRAGLVKLYRRLITGAIDAGAFNLGSGTGHSVLDVIRCVERVTSRRVRYRLVERRPGDTARLVASSARAQAELGWTPEYVDLERIVASAWAWHRGHPGGYGD